MTTARGMRGGSVGPYPYLPLVLIVAGLSSGGVGGVKVKSASRRRAHSKALDLDLCTCLVPSVYLTSKGTDDTLGGDDTHG
jgi:hypothetical protein